MNSLIIDVSGKVPLYDKALCESIYKQLSCNDIVKFLSPSNPNYQFNIDWFVELKGILPSFLQDRYNILRRMLKAVEVFYNYFNVISYIKKNKPDIVHFQWLPLLEICEFESFILGKIHNSGIKIVLTVHNMYPHNSSDNAKEKYKSRFCRISQYVDAFIVHTESSKDEFCRCFGINKSSVHVVYHGIFEAQYIKSIKMESKSLNFTMFGTQSKYKGTDLFIKAYSSLSENLRKKAKAYIIGPTSKDFYLEYCDVANACGIIWNTNRVSDEELFQAIENSDVIFLPYRAISQSGVLLQALYFRKSIATSDLPSFKETLEGFDSEWFFKTEDSDSISFLMEKYINNEIDIDKQRQIVEQLNHKYSWNESANKTIEVYSSLLKC